MKLADFLIQEEGNDSRRLPDGRYASTWDSLGHVWNIGPGITVGITKNTVFTQDQLNAAEAKEFADVEACVARTVKVPVTENQRIALESLAYNIGDAGFEHSSVLRELNAGHYATACQDFLMWDHAGGAVCPGLIKRRKDEMRLFNHPDDVPVPADLRAVKTPLTATMKPGPAAMTTTALATPIAAPVALVTPTAGVNVSTSSVVSHLLGSFMSAAVGVGVPLLTVLQGTTWGHYVAGGLFGVAGFGALASNVYQMVTNNTAASNNTMAAINQVSAGAASILAQMQAAQITPITQAPAAPLTQAAA
jgi:lysozyme